MNLFGWAARELAHRSASALSRGLTSRRRRVGFVVAQAAEHFSGNVSQGGLGADVADLAYVDDPGSDFSTAGPRWRPCCTRDMTKLGFARNP